MSISIDPAPIPLSPEARRLGRWLVARLGCTPTPAFAVEALTRALAPGLPVAAVEQVLDELEAAGLVETSAVIETCYVRPTEALCLADLGGLPARIRLRG